jgi:hypothetical protein
MKMAMTGEFTTYRDAVRRLFLQRHTIHHIIDYIRLLWFTLDLLGFNHYHQNPTSNDRSARWGI